MKSIKDLWKPEDLALKLGVSTDVLLSWRDKGMPYIKISKYIYIPEPEFVRWMSNGLVNVKRDEKDGVDPKVQKELWDDPQS